MNPTHDCNSGSVRLETHFAQGSVAVSKLYPVLNLMLDSLFMCAPVNLHSSSAHAENEILSGLGCKHMMDHRMTACWHFDGCTEPLNRLPGSTVAHGLPVPVICLSSLFFPDVKKVL